ncbi:OsmC family protein [Fontimonas sp. SYSU GA230001]|uniref:OsmC family protein n=1 Tax=Fontimonas sp. SYSU GA230001 TaxID=3142450 RepID=UPI0032B31187
MSAQHDYHAIVHWQRAADEVFTDGRYSRGHRWRFDGDLEVPASASPQIVPPPHSVAAAVDPEEAFVAALASCHMLFFLSHAARAGFVCERYEDAAVGTMGRDVDGRIAMLGVRLRPRITWGGSRQPDAAAVARLHERAHHDCFLARSVRCPVVVEAEGAR